MKILRPSEWKSILLTNSERIILASEYETGDALSLYDLNHNIFRLDKDGNVVWQVKREEKHKDHDKFLTKNLRPFGELWLEDAKGKRFRSQGYVSGCKLIALADGSKSYEVNIETGVAIDITEYPTREW